MAVGRTGLFAMPAARSEGDLRVLIRGAESHVRNAESVLRRRNHQAEQAELERAERFSNATMKKEANDAAAGLNFANIDELRSLKFDPPPIAELVARCVCTLVSADEVGLDGDSPRSPRPSSEVLRRT